MITFLFGGLLVPMPQEETYCHVAALEKSRAQEDIIPILEDQAILLIEYRKGILKISKTILNAIDSARNIEHSGTVSLFLAWSHSFI